MIIVGLMGGLGNQLFQYSAGRRLSLSLGTKMALDPSFLQKDHGAGLTKRPFMLDRFQIAANVIKPEDLEIFFREDMPGWKIWTNGVCERMTGGKVFKNPRMFIERDQNFEPALLELPDNRYLYGYFQSDRYFRDARETILEDLIIKAPMDRANQEMAGKIGETRSVCLHVRRGDYITNPDANRIHGVDLTDYYRRSVKLLSERLDDCHYFIFSDEPDWVRRNLDLRTDSTVVDINSPDEPEQDLRLMSLCEHFIIANSSFSWWGAWLSRNPDKVVIAPQRWFLDDRNTRDRCPEGWIRI